MTKDELIKRMQAGERVTLYYPYASNVGVGSRTFVIEPDNKDFFRITYSNGIVSKYPHKLDSSLLDSSLLDTFFRTDHMLELWWVAYARSVALNQDLLRAKQDA